jgi:hypothetical protein
MYSGGVDKCIRRGDCKLPEEDSGEVADEEDEDDAHEDEGEVVLLFPSVQLAPVGRRQRQVRHYVLLSKTEYY